MNKVNRLLLLYALSFIVFKETLCANELIGIFYNPGALVDTITCNFSELPVCIYEAPLDVPTEGKEACFFIPFTRMRKKELQQTMNSMQPESKAHYRVSIESITKPVQGLRIRFIYDPEQVRWDYSPSDSISEKKSLVFKLYKKQLLRSMSQHSSPLRLNAFIQRQPRTILPAAIKAGLHCQFYRS